MNSPRMKKIQFLTDSSQRAQRLNNAADRILEQKISHYKREEKQLQKELANLRKTKETLDAGIKLIFPQRGRSNSEPVSPRLLERTRRGSGFSVHETRKLPPIVTSSPISSRKCVISRDDSFVAEKKASFLSLTEKEPGPQRAHSSENLEVKKGSKNTSLKGNQVAAEEKKQGSSPNDELMQSGVKGFHKVALGRTLSAGSVSCSPVSSGLCHGSETSSFLSPLSCLPVPPKSPQPRKKRSNSLFSTPSSSKTNAELMAAAHLSGKFKSVGQCTLGAAVIKRLNGTFLEVEDIEEDEEDAACYEMLTRRRQTIANIKSPMMSRKAKSCWKQEVNSSKEEFMSSQT